MSDGDWADWHMWSLRRSKANYFRLMSVFSVLFTLVKWFGDVCTWKNPATTVLIHVLLVMLMYFHKLILPALLLFMSLLGIWNYKHRPCYPPYMDTRISCSEAVHLDELDEEFDTFPTSRSMDVVRMRYDRMHSVAGRIRTVVGDVATYGESPRAAQLEIVPLQDFSGISCLASFPVSTSPKSLLYISRPNSSMASQSVQSVHDFTVKDARGKDVDLSTYKGKVLLIVNVASQCGLTNSNYTELAQLYEKYKNQGFEILAFPCNQFGGQEPGTNEEILETACTRFKAEYPIFDKVDVNGNNAAPVYKFLKSSKGGLFGDGIKWNFAKFLVNKDGHVVDRYAPTTSPLSIEKDIKKLLEVKLVAE
ncbi:hypothetical protein MRB53_032486 [Persea americana]|uniref:Uncharacterized protein n=1 Tax=Persea americana TaxID=3435 RepID=A0ACC2KS08_PERAE|nr:hypothetical protein MRB53_032486 [Persea americana]